MKDRFADGVDNNMASYPMIFSASANAPSGIANDWSSTTKETRRLTCSVPGEFGGPNTGFSPEDLYLAALTNCFIATLKVIAANSKMEFGSIEASASLTLDRETSAAAPWMKQADLHFVVRKVENVERFTRMLERVSKQCMIINSVKTEVRFTFEVEATL